MTLQDQLDELRSNMLRDRSSLVTGGADQLWTDATLLRYIKEGEYRFARKAMVIRDGTTPRFSQLTLATGVIEYPMPAEVFAVMSARPEGKTRDLARTGRALVQTQQVPAVLDFSAMDASTVPPGPPLAYYTDETMVYANAAAVTICIFPAPSAAEDGTLINLRVLRVPQGGYTSASEDLARESEIPEGHQLDVLEWAAYLAQRNNDADAANGASAEDHRKAFEDAVAEAKRELRRSTHVNTGFRYGGNGFSWDR